MGLAFEAINPDIFPVALKLFKSGMDRFHVAGKIFKQFGKKWDVPENELHTAMIDLSITEAESCVKSMETIDIIDNRFDWLKLSKMQIGKYAEYYAKMEFTLYGFEVFTTEVDDRGIDFIIKDKHKNFLEIQVKSIRNSNYVLLPKEKFDITNKNLYLVLLIFNQNKIPDMFLIPANTWEIPNSLFVNREYNKPEQKSKPEWGLNISGKTMEILNEYKFANRIKELL